MNMNTNFLSEICIKSKKEFSDFSKQIETIRQSLSYYSFKAENDEIDTTTSSYMSTIKINQESDKMLQYSIFFLLRNIKFISLIKISLYMLIILISLLGNLLIIVVICSNRFMKMSTNYFILNLALCNLSILFSCIWVQMIRTLSDFWLLGEIYCKLNSYLQMVSIIASVLTLSLMLVDRYIGIMYPLKLRMRMTKKKSFFSLILIWIISFIISMPTFFYRTYTERKWLDFTEKQCDDFGWPLKLVYDDKTGCVIRITRFIKHFYFTSVILLLFFLPILVMTITYTIIIRKLWTIKKIGEEMSMNMENILKKRKKIILMLVLILISFVVCWLPLETMLLFMELTDTFPSWWAEIEWIAYFMAYSNTAINPYIYAGLSENYKHGFRRLRTRLFGFIPSVKKASSQQKNRINQINKQVDYLDNSSSLVYFVKHNNTKVQTSNNRKNNDSFIENLKKIYKM